MNENLILNICHCIITTASTTAVPYKKSLDLFYPHYVRNNKNNLPTEDAYNHMERINNTSH